MNNCQKFIKHRLDWIEQWFTSLPTQYSLTVNTYSKCINCGITQSTVSQ